MKTIVALLDILPKYILPKNDYDYYGFSGESDYEAYCEFDKLTNLKHLSMMKTGEVNNLVVTP